MLGHINIVSGSLMRRIVFVMLPCKEQQAAAYKGNRKIEFCPDLESFMSRLNVILRHDLTLSVGEPDNAAAQTGAGTSFGANGDPIT